MKHTYFSNHDYIRHDDNVWEAKDFIPEDRREAFIRFIEMGETSCSIHDHSEHCPREGYWEFTPECFKGQVPGEAGNDASIRGLSSLLHAIMDSANRYTMEPMKLAKVVMHKYIPNASGPPHTDIFPLATLAYFNDDYDGGELYFPDQDLEIKPQAGSLLVFRGGGEYLHGVRRVGNDSNRARYVLVAFWEYEEKSPLVDFWEREQLSSDQRNLKIQEIVDSYTREGISSEVLYPDVMPILVIKGFLSQEELKYIPNFLNHNDLREDECWGPVCFREYWERSRPKDILPELTVGVTHDTLKEINARIKEHVEFFLGEEVAFSKFKGHNHVNGASTPPHFHGPAVAVAFVTFGDDYAGGETFIPKYNISFKPQAGDLYIFAENEDVKHGVSRVRDGDRQSLISHWQSPDEKYDWAGVNNY